MISNFNFFPYFNISQKFVQNVQKTKNSSVLSCCNLILGIHLRIT